MQHHSVTLGVTFDLAEVILNFIILIFSRPIDWGCRLSASWCDLDLTFELTFMTLIFNTWSGLYLRNLEGGDIEILCGDIGFRV